MKLRIQIITLLLLFASLLQATEVARPNIILVFIDDMGWSDFSCFGNTEASTPNIDRMAGEGIAFGQFYVNAPICSPSRVAISTGQYPHRWRITSYLDSHDVNARRDMADWLDPSAPMLARQLHSAGYATGHFGKWHMGGQRDVDTAPPISDYGFDESLTNFEGMGPKLLPVVMKPGYAEPRRIWKNADILGGPVIWKPRCEITGGFVDAAISFMKRAEAAGKPFYINLWPDDVHSPFFPTVENWSEDKRTVYLAVLEEMDRQFGPLFDHVRESEQLRDNTLVLICSDNGPEDGAGSALPLKGGKAQVLEGGIRSPLVVWGPGLVNPDAVGSRDDSSFFAAFDLVPSLLNMAGLESPEGAEFDGEDLSATILGRAARSRRDPVCWSRPGPRREVMGASGLPDLAVRHGKWKLTCNYDGSDARLHDISRDPTEDVDLSGQEPEIAARLLRFVTQWFEELP